MLQELAARNTQSSTAPNLMILKSVLAGFLKMLLILVAFVILGALTQAAGGASFPQLGREKHWLLVEEFADSVVHFAYAKSFVQGHEGPPTERQCQQYSRIAVDYADQLAAVKQAGVFAQPEFWNEVRAYSISMIGAPGEPIPGRRASKYWVTTGSELNDRELRRTVSLEIAEASSQLIRTGGYFPSALTGCRTAPQELISNAER